MNQPVTYQGRSFLFNVLFVLLNLTGLSLVVIGFHKNFEDKIALLLSIGFGLITLSTAGLLIFRGRILMAGVSRILVGGLCIVSGLVKANDPLGFSYKLKEYFEDGALAYRIKELFGSPGFSLEFLIDYALIIGIIICVAEIVLGVLLIIGGKIKTVSYFTLLMMLFFTFLTWHTANCDSGKKFIDRNTYAMSDQMALLKIEETKTNKSLKIVSRTSDYLVIDEKKSPQCVDDCGCFGDALKGSVGRSLTPDESFWKDLILVYLVLWIFMTQWIIKPNTVKQNLVFSISSIVLISLFSWVFGWYFPIIFGIMVLLGALWIVRAGGKYIGNYGGATIIVSFISMMFITYVLMYEPMKDYRPFAVGSNLIDKMNDGVDGKYESMLVYKNKKTGVIREYSSTSKAYTNSKIWENKDWVYKSMVQKVIIETKLPSISDFEPSINLSDVSKDELKLEYVQNAVKNSRLMGLKIKDIVNNISSELPLADYNLMEYPSERFKILDTIEITDPNVTDINIKNLILNSKTIVILSSSNLASANFSEIEKMKKIYSGCQKKDIPFILICTASRSEIESFKKKYNFHVPIFVNDEKTIQAVSRSNPCMLVIKNAVVKGKFPHRALPSFEWLNTNILIKK